MKVRLHHIRRHYDFCAHHSHNLACFIQDMVRHFFHNQGLLLAGSIAFYTLLSLLPILLILIVTLSQFIPQEYINDTSRTYLSLLIPQERSELFLQEAYRISQGRNLSNIVSLLSLLFFSSMVFRVLQRAMFAMFGKPMENRRKRSARFLLPYILVLLLVAGFSLSVLLNSTVHSMPQPDSVLLQHVLAHLPEENILLRSVYFLGSVVLLTLIYRLLAPIRIHSGHAFVAALLVSLAWHGIQGVLAWYYTSVSQLNVVFGTFSTLVVLLLTLEVAAIILLLGTQLIVDLGRRDQT